MVFNASDLMAAIGDTFDIVHNMLYTKMKDCLIVKCYSLVTMCKCHQNDLVDDRLESVSVLRDRLRNCSQVCSSSRMFGCCVCTIVLVKVSMTRCPA